MRDIFFWLNLKYTICALQIIDTTPDTRAEFTLPLHIFGMKIEPVCFQTMLYLHQSVNLYTLSLDMVVKIWLQSTEDEIWFSCEYICLVTVWLKYKTWFKWASVCAWPVHKGELRKDVPFVQTHGNWYVAVKGSSWHTPLPLGYLSNAQNKTDIRAGNTVGKQISSNKYTKNIYSDSVTNI